MLIRNNELSSPDEYYNDSLLKLPTLSHSIFNNLASGFATPVVALEDVNSTLSGKPNGNGINNALSAIELENSTPGMGIVQQGAGYVSNVIGQIFNPLSIMAGGFGGLAAKGIVSGVEKIAPSAVSALARKPISEMLNEPLSKYVPSVIGTENEAKPLSFGLIGDKSLEAFGTGSGFGLPQGIVDNYNNDSNSIKWGGVAREMGETGSMGIAIGSIPFTLGLLKGKVNRAIGESLAEDISLNNLNKALEKGRITQDEHQWYLDYLDAQKNPSDIKKLNDVKESATKIVSDNGQPINSALHEVPYEIVSQNNIENLKSAIADQLTSDIPENQRTALSDFINHKQLDDVMGNQGLLDGLRGYSDFIAKKLENKEPKLKEADELLNNHIEKGLNELAPISQKSLIKNMKKIKSTSSHSKNIPLTIPEKVNNHLDQLSSIRKINISNKKLFKKFKKTGNNFYTEKMKENDEKINSIQSNLEKPISPAEELKQIKHNLLDSGLKENYKSSIYYHRLLDLSQVWKNARILLDRLNIEQEYNKQSAFKKIVDHVLQVADEGHTKFAKPENVINYLRDRIHGNLSKEISLSDIKQKVDDERKVPQNEENLLEEQKTRTNKNANELSSEFEISSDRFKEFKKSGNIFKNLISCVIGAVNA